MKTHSYPYCYRSDSPLIYRAVPSWFVAVEKIKTEWVPKFVKEKRFLRTLGTGQSAGVGFG